MQQKMQRKQSIRSKKKNNTNAIEREQSRQPQRGDYFVPPRQKQL